MPSRSLDALQLSLKAEEESARAQHAAQVWADARAHLAW
jgi:hypothetical protein